MSSAYPPMDSGFERKEYVVTNLCEKFLTPFSPLMCFSLKQRLILEPEEAILITSTCCSTANERRPYGELGSVDKITACGVCATFQFRSASVSPGWGCSDKLVEDIVTELKARMKARGDTSQIQRAEQNLAEIQLVKADIANLNAKIDTILNHLKIQQPQPVAAASMVERV